MSSSHATLAPQLQELLGRFGLELAVVEAGRDRDLLPINSFALEITDLCAAATVPDPLREAAAALRGWIDRIFDSTALFDEPTIALLSHWHGWMETAITALERGNPVAAIPAEFSGTAPVVAEPARPAPAATASAAGFVKVDTAKLDALIDGVRELSGLASFYPIPATASPVSSPISCASSSASLSSTAISFSRLSTCRLTVSSKNAGVCAVSRCSS